MNVDHAPRHFSRDLRVMPLVIWGGITLASCATNLIAASAIPAATPAFLIGGPLIRLALAPAVIWWALRHPLGRATLGRHAAAAMIFSALHLLAVRTLFEPLQLASFGIDLPGAFLVGPVAYFSIAFATSFLQQHDAHSRAAIRAAERRREVAQSRLHLFRTRIPQHVLRSSLGGLVTFVSSGKQHEALELLSRFASYLRGVLESVRTGNWPLSSELDLARRHAALLAALPGATSRLEVRDSEESEVPVATGELQDLVTVSAGKLNARGAELHVRRESDGTFTAATRTETGELVSHAFAPAADAPPDSGEPPARELSSPDKRWIAWAIVIGILSMAAFGIVQRYQRGWSIHPMVILTQTIGVHVIVLLLIAATVPLLTRLRNTVSLALAAIVTVIACSFAGCFLHAVLLSQFIPRRTPFTPVGFLTVVSNIGPPATLGSGVLLLTLAAAEARRRTAQQVAVAGLERELATSRLALIRSQLHPHFLFNALNSLGTLIRIDPAAAVATVDRLQSFYAKADELFSDPIISLEEELGLIHDYLSIESVRFGARLQVRLDVAPDSRSSAIPALLLQPLVENAIKHGIARHGGPGFVHLSSSVTSGTLAISVANSRRTTTVVSPSDPHIGLAATREQLDAVFPGVSQLRLKAEDDRFEVRIEFPSVGVAALREAHVVESGHSASRPS